MASLILFITHFFYTIFQSIPSYSTTEEFFIILTLCFIGILLIIFEINLLGNIKDVMHDDYHSPVSLYDLGYYLKEYIFGFILILMIVFGLDYLFEKYLFQMIAGYNYILGLMLYNIFWGISRYIAFFNIKEGIDRIEGYSVFLTGFIDLLNNYFFHSIIVIIVYKYMFEGLRFLYALTPTLITRLAILPVLAYVWAVAHHYLLSFDY